MNLHGGYDASWARSDDLASRALVLALRIVLVDAGAGTASFEYISLDR